MKRVLTPIILASLLFATTPVFPVQAAETEPLVQVKLVNYLGNQLSLTFVPNGDYFTSDYSLFLQSGVSYTIKQENGQLSLYQGTQRLTLADELSLTPFRESDRLAINNRFYAGSFRFVVEDNKYVRPINSLYMEDYLKGVVPIEMYTSWNAEALKSQAVAARSYAMSYVNTVINDTVSYQAYGGDVGTVSTNQAVDATQGEVLMYNGKAINAVFSASNGGVTESNSNAWIGSTPVPYFGVKSDSYDPKTTWNFSLSKQQIDLTGKDLSRPDGWWSTTKEKDSVIASNIKTWLYSNGYTPSDIKLINVSSLSLYDVLSGGRVNKGSITLDYLAKGKTSVQRLTLTDLASSKIRAMIGSRIMTSFLVDKVDSSTSVIAVAGRGDGHGVGMSQWGAKYRGDAGQSYRDILGFYYSGASLEKTYALHAVDTVTPIVSNHLVSYDATSNVIAGSYSLDELSRVTIYVKDEAGNLVQTLYSNVLTPSGDKTYLVDASAMTDGTYTFVITATDGAGNIVTSSATSTLFKPKTGTVTASSLSVRSGPGTTYSILGYVKLNQTVRITGKEGNWYLIDFGTTKGYVSATYITNVQ